MSGPPVSLPPEIAALMTVVVVWEKSIGRGIHAEPTFAPPVSLNAWAEGTPLIAGGVVARRRGALTDVEPQYTLYFDGNDARVQDFSYRDRFTVPATPQMALQPVSIDTFYGPPFDNLAPWLVAVSL